MSSPALNLHYVRIDLVRTVREASTVLFIFLMPVFMYLVFGAGRPQEVVLHANLRFHVAAGMAAYGATTGAVSVVGQAATESMQGWGRQIALTRAPARGYLVDKVALTLLVCGSSTALTLLVARLTGAHAEPAVWWLTLLGCLVASLVFAVYGLGVALVFRAESAVGIASAGMVFFSFLGNVFTPLTGQMLALGRLTPMYPVMGLVRWPELHGAVLGDQGLVGHDPLWRLVLGTLAWLAAFSVLALKGVRRARARR